MLAIIISFNLARAHTHRRDRTAYAMCMWANECFRRSHDSIKNGIENAFIDPISIGKRFESQIACYLGLVQFHFALLFFPFSLFVRSTNIITDEPFFFYSMCAPLLASRRRFSCRLFSVPHSSACSDLGQTNVAVSKPRSLTVLSSQR